MSDAAASFRGNPRFRILRRVGAGGAGVVYEAFDREHGVRVALKTLKAYQADAFMRFKDEFRLLQDVQHPNLVSLGELFEEGGVWFFTMEFVEGEDLLSYVRPGAVPPPPSVKPAKEGETTDAERTVFEHGATVRRDAPTVALTSPPAMGSTPAPAPHDVGEATVVGGSPSGHEPTVDPESRAAAVRAEGSGDGRFDDRRLRSVLVELTQGLAALHGASRVHRDIKPSNVIVTAEGRVVIVDFGLVLEVTRAAEEIGDDAVVGTVQYMAPEQAAGLPVGPASDWYGVGVLLYKALTGVVPFAGTIEDVLMAKQRYEPTPPHRVAAGVPQDLSELCMDLLRVTPELRPNAAQILARLGAVREEDRPSLHPSRVQGPVSAAFLGREYELALLREAFEGTLGGQTSAMLVEGESGIGKSTLVRSFAESVVAEYGAIVLSGRCYEREAVPYKAVDGLIDSLSHRLMRVRGAEAKALVTPKSALLPRLFPALRRVHAFDALEDKEPLPLDPKELRAELFAAIRELLSRLAERWPLVLIVDDLQWSDADSLALLGEVLRPPDAPALLFVGTTRKADAAMFPGDVRILRLEALPEREARELAERLLGTGGDTLQSEALAAAIAREAQGHPLFIDELVRHALRGEASSGQGVRFDDALGRRIERFDEAARRILDVVCIAGVPVPQEAAARASRLTFADFARQVSTLRIASLVRTGGARRSDVIEPYHDRVRACVTGRLDAAGRRRNHEALAVVLEQMGGARSDVLAELFAGAGPDSAAKAADYSARAGTDAARALAFDQAARFFRRAMELAPARSAELRPHLAEALANAGRGFEAANEYLGASQEGAPGVRLNFQRLAAEQFLFSGHHDEGMAVLRTVLDAMDMPLAESPRVALASFLVRRTQLRLRGRRFVKRPESAVSPEELQRVDMLCAVAMSLGMVDTIRGADFQTRHLLYALKVGEPFRVARALSLETAFSATGGTKAQKQTARIAAEATELAEHIHDIMGIGWARGGMAIAAFLEGRWKEALALFEAGQAVLRERVGATWEIDSNNFYQLGCLVHLGQLRELSRRIPVLLAEAERRGDQYAMTQLRTGVLTLAWLARDDAEGARREAQDAIDRWSSQGTHLPHFMDVLSQGQIDLYVGDVEGAYRRVNEAAAALSGALLLRIQFVRIKMIELRGRCALAKAALPGAPVASLLADVHDAARALDDEEAPWAACLGQLLRAAAARIRGQTPEALALLEGSHRQLTALDMALHAAVVAWRRGEMLGGAEGDAITAEARAFLEAQAVVNPARMVALLAPGF